MTGGEVYVGTRQYKTDGKVSRGVKDGDTYLVIVNVMTVITKGNCGCLLFTV